MVYSDWGLRTDLYVRPSQPRYTFRPLIQSCVARCALGGNSIGNTAEVARCACVIYGRPILVSCMPISIVHVRRSLSFIGITEGAIPDVS